LILHELCGLREDHPAYRALEVSNGNRQYDFLRSIVQASIDMGKPFISSHILKALNFQAISCLHTNAGEYRPCEVRVGQHQPPDWFRVQALMDDLVNTVNRNWVEADSIVLAAYVLWRLNHIHPFINGNGRTARAAAYFVLCVQAGGWLPGATILPELIRMHRARYVAALQQVDQSLANGQLDLAPLHTLLQELLNAQIASAPAPQGQVVPPAAP
jgi:fido (protein-threonine AMPylation protein)